MSDDDLKTRMIYLDTNTYIAKNFQFGKYDLDKLRSFIDSENLYLLITDVNISEVKNHIKRRAIEAASVIRKAAKDAMILRNNETLPAYGIFSKIDPDAIYEEIVKSFDKFLEGGNVEVVSVSTANIKDIFDDYFAENPPFDSVNKKAEFPDAFVLSAISRVAAERRHKLYVVSSDGDFKRYCARHNHLISLERVDQLLDIIVRNSEELAAPAKFADMIYDDMKQDIEDQVRDMLGQGEFNIEHGEFDIDDVTVESVEFLERNIVDVSSESAIYEVKLKMSVVVDASYIDYDNSPYDREEGKYLYIENCSVKVRYQYKPTIVVYLNFHDGIRDNAELESVDFDEALNLLDVDGEILSRSSEEIRNEYDD